VWAALAATPIAQASNLEISAHIGQVLPFYEQSFTYDPGSVVLTVPGVPNIDIRQRGGFQLDGKGGSTIAGAVTIYIVPSFGIEGRIDSAAIDIKSTGARYNVAVDLPSPIPDLSTDLDFGNGLFDVDRLRPISANLKFKTPGALAFTVSGGISYLPEIQIAARQRLGLGVTAFDSRRSELTVGSLLFSGRVSSDSDDASKRIGGNIGAGLRLTLGGPLSISGEGRYFVFPKHRLDWEPQIEGPLSPLESQLLGGVRDRIEPIEFYPTFFQLTAGVSLTF
jgi:hypothetical protein